MARDFDAVMHGLEEAREFARAYRFEITDSYRRLLAQVEALPENQTGSDKSAVWPALVRYVESFQQLLERE